MSLDQMNTFTQVGFNQAYQMTAMCIEAGIVPLIKGSPGLGKSALAAMYAKEHNLVMIDMRLAQCDVTDLIGFPSMNHDTKTASYYPLDTFPTTNTPLPTEIRTDAQGNAKLHSYSGWLLFLDELTSARQDIQAAA